MKKGSYIYQMMENMSEIKQYKKFQEKKKGKKVL